MSDHLPTAGEFPDFPTSWYLFGSASELRRGPVSKDRLGRRLLAFRTDSGQVAVLDARCCHLGADLGGGTVCGESIRCPFHNWEYGADGRCTRIPLQQAIPESVRQRSYPVVQRHGLIFYFNGPEPLFPLPFYPGCRVEDFARARLFVLEPECPWYMVGANGFDVQHFRTAHDRRLCSGPDIQSPHPLARMATSTFEVVGNTVRDRLTRQFAGSEVTLTSIDWCGNLIFATARFRRTVSYGMLCIDPCGTHCRVNAVVYLPRSNSRAARMLLDPLRLEVRRYFIKQFLAADVPLIKGTRYHPAGLIDADRHMAEYFAWLAGAARGDPDYACVRANRMPKPTVQESLANSSVS